MRKINPLILCLFPLVLAACSGGIAGIVNKANEQSALDADNIITGDTGEPKLGDKDIYALAEKSVASGNYTKAISYYRTLERTYPTSPYAEQSKLKIAWAQYKDGEFGNALTELERYATRYPDSDQLDYVYWLQGLCYFERMPPPEQDQAYTIKAMENFSIVTKNWPNSQYAKDAKVKFDILVDQLAAKEMHIGRQYIKKKNYTAALNRFNYVVEKYDTSTHTPEALHRQVESYLALGLYDDAVRTAQVLGHNYPNSKWYGYSYKMLNNQPIKQQSLISLRNPFGGK